MADDQQIPDAHNEATPNRASPIPPLVIGAPFALSDDCEFVERPTRALDCGHTQHPGCVAIVRCLGPEGDPCGQLFRIDLLEDGTKTCPRCKTQFTHLLLIAPVDDDEVIADAMKLVLQANGYPVPDDGTDEGRDDHG